MKASSCAQMTFLGGAACLIVSLLWPPIPDPRAQWTDEKSLALLEAGQELHSLSHALVDGMQHEANDPMHVHTPGETTDPRLTALEMERANDQRAALLAELDAARQTPAGWHLLLGIAGVVLMGIGIGVTIASHCRADVSE